MKTVLSTLLLIIIYSTCNIAQEFKKNTLEQVLKEDRYNLYQSEQISNLDLLRALELTGIRINKFNFGEFDEKYNLLIAVDEYVNGQIIRTDTLFNNENTYHYYENEGADRYFDYIDQVKFLSKIDDDKMLLFIDTYIGSSRKSIKINKLNDEQFFQWRKYVDTKWKLNQKVPLMIYGSSWEDKKYGFHRFCGVAQLGENENATNELLTLSPNYFVFNYMITEIE